LNIRFVLNGETMEIDVDATDRVIDVLREDLKMTGTKEGCGTGECAACTILVNSESRLACLMLAPQIDGAEITTIEGLSRNGRLHPVQEAFIEYGAIQCGFCTPGMVMASVDLLKRNPRPTEAEIREGISGNLCRCTGYQKIVEAVAAAAHEMEKDGLP
jgi:aerobic carbon-monoxide dehydrogenase small subunit